MALKTILRTNKQIDAEAQLSELGYRMCGNCKKPVVMKNYDGRVRMCRPCAQQDELNKPNLEELSIHKEQMRVLLSYSYCSDKMSIMVADKNDDNLTLVLCGSYADVYEKLQWMLIELGLGDYEWE